MKNVLIDLLKNNGFEENTVENEMTQRCNGLVLQRNFEKEIDVVWHGKRTQTYAIRVFINQNSGICHVSYQQGGREYKNRWYDTIGKRTYNAIVETARCAGYKI